MRPVHERETGIPINETATRTEHGGDTQADLKVAATGEGVARARAVVNGARAAGRSALFEHEGYAVLASFGVPASSYLR